MDAVNASPPRLALSDQATSIQAQSIIDKYEEVGYKVVKGYKEILEIKVTEAFPDLLGRLNHLTRDYAPQLEVPWDQLKEIVWPGELFAVEKQLKGGAMIRFSATKRRQIVLEVHTVLGMIWDDEVDECFVLLWIKGDEEPKILKDYQSNAYLNDVCLENGEQFKVSTFKFDNLEVLMLNS